MYRLEDIAPTEGFDYLLNEQAVAALATFKALETYKEANKHLRKPGLQTFVNDLIIAFQFNFCVNVVDDNDEVVSDAIVDENGITTYSIYLSGRLSIISLLNAFYRIQQIHENQPEDFVPRQRAAVALFRKVYPEQFAKLVFDTTTGGFALPGSQVGFKARVRRPVVEEVVTDVPVDPFSAIGLGVGDDAVAASIVTGRGVGALSGVSGTTSINDDSLGVRTFVGSAEGLVQHSGRHNRRSGARPNVTPASEDFVDESPEEHDDDYYENESPER